MKNISRFNPYEMSDELIMHLNTGREAELFSVMNIIEKNLRQEAPLQHILLHGPRGSGKSFFLRLLQINLKENPAIKCIILPEEQHNIHQPADLIRVIKNALTGEESSGGIGSWFGGGMDEWNREVREMESLLSKKNHPHIVLGVENFDLILQKGGAFFKSEDQFLLRGFLSEKNYITLIATTLYPDLDTQYDKALFHFFAKHELMPWKEKEHESYLSKRDRVEGKTTEKVSLAQMKALSRFTGGSPRITVIVADILSIERLGAVVATLERTIDALTPFYQDLLDRIPPKSKLLFDALIRGGEPCSQSELANRVGTAQNVISQSFNWLQTHNYLLVETLKGEKQKLYSVRDRMFAHFYKMRYILHGTGKSPLAVMSEFLCRFYSLQDMKDQANVFLHGGMEREDRDLMHLALESSGINPEKLSWKDDILFLSNALDFRETEKVPEPKTFEEARQLLVTSRDMLTACETCPEGIDCEKLANWLFKTLIVLENKIKVAKFYFAGEPSDKQWMTLNQIPKDYEDLPQMLNDSIGVTYKKIEDSLFEGELIFEFLDDLTLAGLKIKDQDLYYSVQILISIFPYLIRHDSFEGELEQASFTLPESETLIEAHRYLLKRNEEAGRLRPQAWHLEQIGSELFNLSLHKEALDVHQKAFELMAQEKDISGQAIEFGQIGRNLNKLGRHEEAINAHQKAFKLTVQEKDLADQANELGQIGINLNKLGRHEEAIATHQRALDIWSQEKYISNQAWNLGQIAAIMLAKGDEDKAWQFIDEQTGPMVEMRYRMIQQIGDAICFHERAKETAKAFALAGRILEHLHQRKDTYDPSRTLQEFFTNLLSEKFSLPLLKDIYDAAIEQFGEGVRLDLEGIAGVIEFLMFEKDQRIIQKMDPEKRRAVEAIIDSLDLA